MTHVRSVFSRCLLILVCIFACSGAEAQEGTSNWLPISPEDLAMKESPGGPGAAAVALYRESNIDAARGSKKEYFRIKVLSEAGLKYADVSIPFVKGSSWIEDIQARTVHSDGKVIDFDGNVLEKSVERVKKTNFLAKTFALPDVQPGSIIEYKFNTRWKTGPYASGFASEWVINDVLFTRLAHFSFLPIPGLSLLWSWSDLPAGKKPLMQEGTVKLEVENIPPFHEEPYAPPEEELKGRVDFFYVSHPGATQGDTSTDWFWKESGKVAYQRWDHEFIGNAKNVEKVVQEVTNPGDSPEQKLHKLYDRAQQIRNLNYESRKTAQEKKEEGIKENHSAAEVLKRDCGTASEINMAFLALARAAGFEGHIVDVSSRRGRYFHRGTLIWNQFTESLAEIQLGGRTILFDPGNPYCPSNLLPWDYTSVKGLRLEKEGGVFIDTPDLLSAGAITQQKASFQLAEDGNLQGTVRVEFTGEVALQHRVDNREKDEAGRKKYLEEEIKHLLPPDSTVELTRVGSWDAPEPTLDAEFSLQVPRLASSTGRRLLLPLAVFQTLEENPFQAEKRVYPIDFHYPYERSDEIFVQLPQGYQAETPANPGAAHIGPLTYEIACELKPDGLHIRRHLSVGKPYFTAGAYPSVRQFFQEMKARDEQLLVLKRVDTGRAQ